MQRHTATPGAEVEVVSLGLQEATLLRAGELGLRVGSTLRVLHRGPLGARVVALGGARLAIDGAHGRRRRGPRPAVTLPTTATATVLLVGNPNAGKSTLFGRMTGTRARVMNAPGTTVEMQRGTWRRAGGAHTVVDLPGTYSLVARSPDEMVVVDALADRDAIALVVLDAAALSRSLYLLAQVARSGRPVVAAVTMLDVARDHGAPVDLERLAAELGVPVVGVDPRSGRGLDEVGQALGRAEPVRGIAHARRSGPRTSRPASPTPRRYSPGSRPDLSARAPARGAHHSTDRSTGSCSTRGSVCRCSAWSCGGCSSSRPPSRVR